MRILAIESSCDESSIAVLNDNNKKLNIELHYINSQIKTHQKYGGVVPEVAARLHVPNLIKMLGVVSDEVSLKKIDYIAVTAGPGLITSLLVGGETAKTMAYLLQKPLLPVNHLTAHLNSVFIGKKLDDIKFPAIALLVSGGHTELIYMENIITYKTLGRTRDDAVGEAFDKVAKLLTLEYPGGPAISRRAKNIKEDKINFPRPMKGSSDFDFSFSGLKTAVLYKVQSYKNLNDDRINNIAYSFQEAVVDVLQHKIKKAIKKYPQVKSLIVAGGVSANGRLREVFKEKFSSLDILFPDLEYCGDNAAMIAADAYIQLSLGKKKNLLKTVKEISRLRPHPNWQINKSLWRH